MEVYDISIETNKDMIEDIVHPERYGFVCNWLVCHRKAFKHFSSILSLAFTLYFTTLYPAEGFQTMDTGNLYLPWPTKSTTWR